MLFIRDFNITKFLRKDTNLSNILLKCYRCSVIVIWMNANTHYKYFMTLILICIKAFQTPKTSPFQTSSLILKQIVLLHLERSRFVFIALFILSFVFCGIISCVCLPDHIVYSFESKDCVLIYLSLSSSPVIN